MAADSEAVNFIAGAEIPSSSSSPAIPLRLPRRLRRRVVAAPTKSAITAEHIEAKLEQAHLRRKRFYELLSSRARPRVKASSSLEKEEELNKRLEAKLNAAEQKRSSIIEKAQARLAKLDELRKAAKADMETRYEKERDELSAKVQSRVKQAEENRTRLLKACSQRSAARRDRITQLLTQKTIKERKYKDCVRNSICQKRAAAARKRSRLLDEEKAKACAMILRVRRAVKSTNTDEAEKEKVEILKQQVTSRLSDQINFKMVQELAISKIIRCWRQFVQLRKTTSALAKDFESLGITQESVKSMSFEQLALKIESPTAIQTTKALLKRLQSWYLNSLKGNGNLASLKNIDNLLRSVVSPIAKGTSNPNKKKKASRESYSSVEAPRLVTAPRYPVRILLCSYVILGHPDAIFNRRTECENELALSAGNFVREFELLLKVIKDGPMAQMEMDPLDLNRITFISQIETFDKAWCTYLLDFVAWKDNDSKFLEDELVRAACALELSLIKNSKVTPQEDNAGLGYDSFRKQVSENQKLLKDKLQQLSGNPGVERMKAALSEIRSRYIDTKNTSSLQSPAASISLNDFSVPAVTDEHRNSLNISDLKNHAPVDKPRFDQQVGSTSFSETADDRLNSVVSGIGENELLVNEVLHKHHLGSSDSVIVSNAGQSTLEATVRETLEKAFWDSVMESLKENDPDFGWILKLVTEIRDELCSISPHACKQEIVDSIDIDILSQALRSGKLDMDYFGKILEFALITLRKLSAPASDDDIKTTHTNFLKELGEILQAEDESKASRALAITKGLRFVLEQIQNLKVEISKARLRMVEPLIKGSLGLEYLRNAFSKRHGSPDHAPTSLPLTKQWLSSVKAVSEEEWHDYLNSLSSLISNELSSEALPATLRTGGSFVVGAKTSSYADSFNVSEKLPECEGERIDLLVRLGLLKLVSEVVGLSSEVLPETLELNLARLRAVQQQLQKIIVVSTCLLILRQMTQILISENLITSPEEIDKITSGCAKRLSVLVDTVEDAGLSEIVETVISSVEDDKCIEILSSKRQILTNMLGKSLQAEDPVFKKVSHTVYLATRGVVLGGNGAKGRELAEMSLRRVGSAILTDDLVKAMELLIVAAMVTCHVHRPWYEELIKSV